MGQSTPGTGAFVRRASTFRQWIQADPKSAWPAEPDRYHLYVSLACPWAHRVLIVRALKGLEQVISVDVVDSLLTERGWTLECRSPGATPDRVNGFTELRQIYAQTDPDYRGRWTVPVLYCSTRRRIVNNESSEIIRMLDQAFGAWARHPEVDLYPLDARAEIDAINAWVYTTINNGVYRCGFARSQAAYDEAVQALFGGLDRAERILSRHRYLTGDRLTEADIRLFVTLIRFDLVYHTHFKCNVRRISDYPALWDFTRALYQEPRVRASTDFRHIKHHYFASHRQLNPAGIIPAGPMLDFDQPTRREGAPSRAS